MIPKNYKCPKCGSTEIKQDRHDKLANFELDNSDLVCKTCGHVDSEIKFLYDGQENLIKHTCRELGLTYKQLGEAIGYGEEAVSKAARTGNISATMNKALLLYLENLELKNKLKTLDALSEIIKQLSK